ncbi:MAG: hypothetical protein ACUVUC_09300 [Thermoguttaceae bacterium]
MNANPQRIEWFRMMVIAAALISSRGLAQGQQTNNHQLRAVPAVRAVTTDGKLDDWDLSGQILCCYDLAKLEKTHSVRAAAMYDADYLYLAFHFKGPDADGEPRRSGQPAGRWLEERRGADPHRERPRRARDGVVS